MTSFMEFMLIANKKKDRRKKKEKKYGESEKSCVIKLERQKNLTNISSQTNTEKSSEYCPSNKINDRKVL